MERAGRNVPGVFAGRYNSVMGLFPRPCLTVCPISWVLPAWTRSELSRDISGSIATRKERQIDGHGRSSEAMDGPRFPAGRLLNHR